MEADIASNHPCEPKWDTGEYEPSQQANNVPLSIDSAIGVLLMHSGEFIGPINRLQTL